MKTLLIYLILSPAHQWEFLAIEHVESRYYCELVARDVSKVFSNAPGNMRIICMDDTGENA